MEVVGLMFSQFPFALLVLSSYCIADLSLSSPYLGASVHVLLPNGLIFLLFFELLGSMVESLGIADIWRLSVTLSKVVFVRKKASRWKQRGVRRKEMGGKPKLRNTRTSLIVTEVICTFS